MIKMNKLIKKLTTIRDQHGDNLKCFYEDPTASADECMIEDFSVVPSYHSKHFDYVFNDKDQYEEHIFTYCSDFDHKKRDCPHEIGEKEETNNCFNCHLYEHEPFVINCICMCS